MKLMVMKQQLKAINFYVNLGRSLVKVRERLLDVFLITRCSLIKSIEMCNSAFN